MLPLGLAQTAGAGGQISLGQVGLLVVLLFLSATLSGSETALTAVGRWKIRQIREEGKDPSGVFALLEKDPTRFITTLLIGNNLVNIAATALVTQITLGVAARYGTTEAVALAYATGIMTFLLLVFGEITPKSFAVHHAVAVARFVIRPVYGLSVVLYPLGKVFTFIASSFLRLFRLEPANSPLITENELRLMLQSAEESGVIEAQEQEMIRGVIDLEETSVREVMVPRVDIVAISEEANLGDLLTVVTEHGYSRVPIYRGTVDDVRGIVFARDLLAFLTRKESLTETRVAELAAPPQYVPETMNVMSLLREMRLRKNHMAIVVDEFGGTAGLVTLEDIIEEITGEIYDETDEEEAEEIISLGDGCYRIRSQTHLETVGSELKVAFDDEGEYDTLAGFLYSRFGYIPQPGETISYEDYRFEVEEADERRILSVLVAPVTLTPAEVPENSTVDG
ncbi:MAG: hemolysin family protein [Deinococcota bacterium]|nr:hemolysin family protein [Deinococcota bacterium]